MNIGLLGMAAALCLSAVGSALGTGYAGMAAVGGWKKVLSKGQNPPFIMVAFAGAPLTQTIYGFLLMLFIKNAYVANVAPYTLLASGIFGGLAIGASSMMQGKVSASACDSLAETGKGTAQYFLVVGIVETVAIFTMVFLLLLLQG